MSTKSAKWTHIHSDHMVQELKEHIVTPLEAPEPSIAEQRSLGYERKMHESQNIHLELESTLLCRFLNEIIDEPSLPLSADELIIMKDQMQRIQSGKTHDVIQMGNLISIVQLGMFEWFPENESDTEGTWMWVDRKSTGQVYLGPETDESDSTLNTPITVKKPLHIRAFETVLNAFKRLQAWQETLD